MTHRPVTLALLGALLVLMNSCASLQRDTLASTADEGLSGEISAVAEHATEVGVAGQAVENLSKIISDRALRERGDWGK